MINPRPWHRDPTNLTSLVDANGRTVYESSGDEGSVDQWDNMHHITECVLAIHDSGIDPTDLPKFVEAVRASQKIYNFAFDLADGPRPQDDETLGDVRLSAMKAVSDAAACLPENRKRGAE